MNNVVRIIEGRKVVFTPQLFMLLPAESTLVVSDIHLAKAGHFRKKGILLHSNIHQKELTDLAVAIKQNHVNRVIITGDLFHSDRNSEFNLFKDLLDHVSDVEFILTEGNHDERSSAHPIKANNLSLVEEFKLDDWVFHHYYSEKEPRFQVFGHIHPVVRLRGKGRQTISAKAFISDNRSIAMPAYGHTTFGKPISLSADQVAFAIVGDEVLEINYDTFSKMHRYR